MAKPATREFTIKLLDMVSSGVLDANDVLKHVLGYMSEAEVKDFGEREGYFDNDEDDSDSLDEDDSDSLDEELDSTEEYPIDSADVYDNEYDRG